MTIHTSPNRFAEAVSAFDAGVEDLARRHAAHRRQLAATGDRIDRVLAGFRDELVTSNERVAAELVESAMMTLEDACRGLLGRTTEGVSR